MNPSPDINGHAPMLSGATLEEFQSLQYWHRGELRDPFTMLFLLFNGIWHLLYFDCGVIFWRARNSPPTSIEEPEIQASYRVVDLGMQFGVRGQIIERYEMTIIPGGSQVEFKFSNGRALIIQNTDDRTSLLE